VPSNMKSIVFDMPEGVSPVGMYENSRAPGSSSSP
jgi:hypothetical protein